jgi:hypothetical protein
MMTSRLLIVAFAFPFAFLGCAEFASAQIRPPQSGMVWDASLQAIRPVQGLPGAWTLGSAVDLGFPVLGAHFAPEKNFVLVVSDSGVAIVTGLSAGKPTVVPVENALNGDLVTLNDTGTSALLYSKSQRSVQWLQGLPNHPTVARTISLADLSGDVTAMAVNRRGDLSWIGVAPDANSGSLYNLPVGGDLNFVGNIHAASIVFAQNDRDAYLSDSAAGDLMLESDGQGLSVLADGSAGLRQPGALQMVGATLLIADPTAGNITCFDITHGVTLAAALPAPATQIERFGTDGLFQLNPAGSGPVYVLDGGSLTVGSCAPAVLFIPPDQASASQSAGQ